MAPERDVTSRRNPAVDLLTPHELKETKERQVTSGSENLTSKDPNDTLGDPIVKRTMRQLVELAGRLVGRWNGPGSVVTALLTTIDYTGNVDFSRD